MFASFSATVSGSWSTAATKAASKPLELNPYSSLSPLFDEPGSSERSLPTSSQLLSPPLSSESSTSSFHSELSSSPLSSEDEKQGDSGAS